MEPQVVRTLSLPEQEGCFPDTLLPGFRVRNRFVVGAAGGPAAAEVPDGGLYVEVLTCPAGESLGEHRHPHTEAFLVLDGDWQVEWRADEDSSSEGCALGRWDLVWVPAGWWRSARNVGVADGHMLVLAGTGHGSGCDLPEWLQRVVDGT